MQFRLPLLNIVYIIMKYVLFFICFLSQIQSFLFCIKLFRRRRDKRHLGLNWLPQDLFNAIFFNQHDYFTQKRVKYFENPAKFASAEITKEEARS